MLNKPFNLDRNLGRGFADTDAGADRDTVAPPPAQQISQLPALSGRPACATQVSAARSARRARNKACGTSCLGTTRCRWASPAPDKNAISSGVSGRAEVTQPGRAGKVSKASRAHVMPRDYPSTALSSTILCINRLTLHLSIMSNKFVLSDKTRYARNQFNFITGFVG